MKEYMTVVYTELVMHVYCQPLQTLAHDKALAIGTKFDKEHNDFHPS